MSIVGRTAARTLAPVRHRLRPVSTAGVTALALTKAGDLTTTLVGLWAARGLVERNPVAAHALALAGPLGLLCLSLVGVTVVIVVVEIAVDTLDHTDDFDGNPAVIYYLSYVPLSLLYTAVTVHNLALIAAS